MGSCVESIMGYVGTHTHTYSTKQSPESLQHRNEQQISAYSCITHTLILFCVVIMP